MFWLYCEQDLLYCGCGGGGGEWGVSEGKGGCNMVICSTLCAHEFHVLISCAYFMCSSYALLLILILKLHLKLLPHLLFSHSLIILLFSHLILSISISPPHNTSPNKTDHLRDHCLVVFVQ